jgi:hypothetical protein
VETSDSTSTSRTPERAGPPSTTSLGIAVFPASAVSDFVNVTAIRIGGGSSITGSDVHLRANEKAPAMPGLFALDRQDEKCIPIDRGNALFSLRQ